MPVSQANAKVSYLIVTYRSAAEVGKLIDSILEQEVAGKAEIIIVDNSASETSSDVVRGKLPMVKFFQNERNVGFTAATNQALREASGEFLFFLNPDIILQPGCTQTLVDAFVDKTVGAVAPQLLNKDNSIQMSVRNFPRFSTLIYEATGLARVFPRHALFGHWRNHRFNHDELSSVEQPMASALMVRREVTQEVGEWDEQFFIFFSDVDYCRRIIDAGYRIMFVPDAKAVHTAGGSTRKEGPWLVWDSHRGFRRYLRKHELNGLRALLRPFASFILWLGGVTRTGVRKILRRKF